MPTPNVKVLVAEVSGTELEYPQERLLHAQDAVFDPAGSGIVATDVNAAIIEVKQGILSLTKTLELADYAGGNANAIRYLEWYQGISSLDAPIEALYSMDILDIVLRTTAITATCTVTFYNVVNPASPVLLYTLTMSGVKKVVASGNPLFTVPAGGALACRVNTGSITKPHMQVTIRSG